MLGAKNGTDETMGLTQMELELSVNEPVGTMEPLETNGTSEEDTSPTHILNEVIKPEAKAQKQTKYDHFVSFVKYIHHIMGVADLGCQNHSNSALKN